MEELKREEVVANAKKTMLERLKEGLFYKNGQFSKTAFFTSLANALVLTSYALAWFSGTSIPVGGLFTWTVPPFDTGAAVGLLSVINGTYIGNHYLGAKAENEKRKTETQRGPQ